MKRFLLRISFITFMLAAIGAIVFVLFAAEFYMPIFPLLLILLYGFTILSFYIQYNYLKKSFAQFTRVHMITTLLRLFVYSLILVLFLALSGENVASFMVVIATLYIVFSILETKELSGYSGK
jgi:hypothetical protein